MKTTQTRAATNLEIGAELRKVRKYSDIMLQTEHRAAWLDAFAIVGPMAPKREARLVALSRELKNRGL